jgi:hypothetical protein
MTTSERLQDEEEVLFRQIHPKFYVAGCEFQAPQKCLRLIKVYAINFIP